MRLYAAALSLLAACDDPADHTGVADTNEPADTDTDSGDSGSPLLLGEDEATFTFTGSYEGATLSLTQVDPIGIMGGTYRFGEVLTSVAITEDALTLDLHAPDASLLEELDPEGHPGVKGVFFVPALHVDTDGDGVPSANEAFLGVSSAWLLYVDGNPSGIQAVPNALRGWNAMLMDMEAGIAMATSSLESMPIFVTLIENPNESVSGTWSVEPDPAMGIVVRSRVAILGGEVEAPTFTDVHAESPFDFVLRGVPPTDHFEEFVDGVSAAVEIPEVYTDVDTDHAYTEVDTREYGVCREGSPIGFVYLSVVSSLGLAVQLVGAGNASGWNAMVLAPEEKFISSNDLTALNSGPACPLSFR